MQMMDLVKYSPEGLERVKYFMMCKGNFRAVRNICEFEETFGFMVKVVRGRKVKHGTTGRCFWMGTRSYAKYPDPWGLKTDTRIGIRDESGNVYWTSIDNIEVIPGTYEAPAQRAKKYNEVYKVLPNRPLYGMEESARLHELRVKMESACKRYNEIRNKTEELQDKQRELKKSVSNDEETIRQIEEIEDELYDLDDEFAEVRSEFQKLEREHRKLWSKEIDSKVS